jgi:asparagine synthase (glutamine-hydrolysing)
MLKTKLDQYVPQVTWRWEDNAWRSGDNWVEPFLNEALEQAAVTDGSSVLLITRERQSGHQDELFGRAGVVSPVARSHYEHLAGRIDAWPLEYMAVEFSAAGYTEIRTGSLGTAPVYLAAGEGTVHGSWDLLDLRDFTSMDKLLRREVARRLTLNHRYSHETAWEGVYRLTERSTARLTHEGLRLRYPEDAKHSAPRSLSANADVIAGYEAMLEHVVTQRPVRPEHTAVELSGGVDSANVAMTLGAMFPKRITSCAMMLGGAAGPQQAHRRGILVEHGGFHDVTVPVLEYPPMHPGGARAHHRCSPYEEFYIEGYDAMLEELQALGVRNIFGGTGGDEMVALRVGERPDVFEPLSRPYPEWVSKRTIKDLADSEVNISPASVVSEVTLNAHASAASMYLRAGMWPVYPLASPELILFGEWLPFVWRKGKRLHRERLVALGLPSEVGYPMLRENFTHVMEQAMYRYGLPLVQVYLDESVLVEYGYVDPDGLRRAYEAANTDGEVAAGLYHFLNWERGIRHFSNT